VSTKLLLNLFDRAHTTGHHYMRGLFLKFNIYGNLDSIASAFSGIGLSEILEVAVIYYYWLHII